MLNNKHSEESTMSYYSQLNYKEILRELKNDFNKRWVEYRPKKNDIKLNNFDILKTLGVGAFGRVILVNYKPSSIYYAMKVLDKTMLVKTKHTKHIINEKKVLQSLNHPFLISLICSFKDNSYLYLVLPFVRGGELFTHLKRKGKFSESLSQFYASQVLLALEYLHYCGLIYRDLKPENILVDSRGYLKLTDFGFCKMINGRTWTFCGTPEYIAPEIILSKGYGLAADWWSFGILIYEMTAGYVPFYSSNTMKMYDKIVNGKFKNAGHFSNDLKDILKNIIQIDLTRRYGNLKNGTNDIKQHRWFRKIHWLQVYKQKVKPLYVPVCKNSFDTSNFDDYDEEYLKIASKDRYKKEFSDF